MVRCPPMKKLLPFLLICFATTPSWAQAKACHEQEYNEESRKVFSSRDEYADAIRAWKARAPDTPHPIALWRAYNIYKKEHHKALSLGNDKRAHCYIGCRISQDIDFPTADYVGWYKEERDLSDCNRRTHFDEIDYIATIKGAEIGKQQHESSTCERACKQLY